MTSQTSSATPTSSSSFISSTTSTSFSSSDSNNTDTDSGNFFTPTSSPPLILAFLAIGLLATAIIAALGWRRVYFARYGSPPTIRRQGRGGEGYRNNGGANGSIGERPKMWDLWTVFSGEGPRTDGTSGAVSPPSSYGDHEGSRWQPPKKDFYSEVPWESVMPISIMPLKSKKTPRSNRNRNESVTHDRPQLTTTSDSTSTSSPTSLFDLPSPIQIMHRRLARFFHHYLSSQSGLQQQHASNVTASTDNDTENNANANDDMTRDPEKKRPPPQEHFDDDDERERYDYLQVTMAIAMPAPRMSLRDGEKDEVRGGGDQISQLDPEEQTEPQLYEYSVGVCRVPWPGISEDVVGENLDHGDR